MSKTLTVVLLVLLVGCGTEPDPITLKGTNADFESLSVDGIRLHVTWRDGNRWCSAKYTGSEALAMMRQWLDANYPEGE